MSAPYLEIAIATPLRRHFHYRSPAASGQANPLPGTRCLVPFGKRQVVGVVLGENPEAGIEPSKIRPVTRVIDESPVLPPPLMRLCQWASAYYHHPIGEVIMGALPLLLRQGEAASAEVRRLHALEVPDALEKLGRAHRQRSLYEHLRSQPQGAVASTLSDFTSAVIRSLIDRGMATWRVESAPLLAPFDPATLVVSERPQLNEEQEQAVAVATEGATTTLLYGITGSGKTEVYLRAIESALLAGKQALVLVPEIALTPQTIRRFGERFNLPVVALHSGLNDTERLDGWRRAASGEAAIVIGTRSAVFTPLQNPGVIVVDEEHDASFKQQDGFRYNARDVAVMRAQIENLPVILGSATPSLESWHNARRERYRLATLTRRAGGATLPGFQLINTRHEPMREGFAESLLSAMGRRLDAGEQILVFLNRRGFSPALLCPDCTWVAGCSRCDARMTVHASTRSLVCHHCGSSRSIDRQCPNCQNEDLVPLGEGTQRIESVLTALFPGVPVLRIDRDSTRSRRAMQSFMDQIATGEPSILVGTQMIAKGHHFPNVTLVVIKDMDAAFYSANYKSSERTGQLILQVGGRAGREEKPGTVAIETMVPHEPMFAQLIDEGYASFADALLEERARHALPPFAHQALLRAESVDRKAALAFLDIVADRLEAPASVEVLGPVSASMERRAGRYRGQLLFSARERKPLHTVVAQAISIAEGEPGARKVRWSVDVDPADLF